MKIKRLEISNIASLKGHHLINFEELNDFSKLLAITGETGAGKSSILNSISIALYGQNYKKGFSQTDLITLGESFGEASLLFELNNVEYISKWSCRVRKKNGELLKKPIPQRQLIQVQNLSEKELDQNAEDIIGLNFEQFSKTIILNQGQFSRFLLSNFSERKKILENLLSNLDLTKLSLLNKRSLDKLKQELGLLESKIEGLTQHNQVPIEELLIQQKNLEEENSAINKNLQELLLITKKIEELKKDIELLISTAEKKKTTEEELKTKTELHNTTQKKFDKSFKSLELIEQNYKKEVPKLRLYIKNRNKLTQLNKTLEYLNKSLKEAVEKSLRNKESNLKNTQKKKSLQEQKKYSKPLPSEEEFKLIQENFAKYRALLLKQEKLNFELTNTSGNSKELNESQERLQKEIQDLDEQISHIQVDGSESELQQSLTETEQQLRQALLSEQAASEKDEKLQQIEKMAQSSDKKLKELDKKASIQLKEIQKLKDAIRGQELEQMILTISQESQHEGHCLVCHNDDLSSLTTQTTSQQQDYQQELKKREHEYQKLEAGKQKEKLTLDRLSLDKEEIQKFLKQSSPQIKLIPKLKQECEALKKRIEGFRLAAQKKILFTENKRKLNTQKQENEKRIEAIKSSIFQYTKDIKEIQSQVNSINTQLRNQLKQEDTSVEKLEKHLQQLSDELRIKQELDYLEKESEQLRLEESSVQKNIAELNQSIAKEQSEIKELKNTIPIEYMSKNLDQVIEEMDEELRKEKELSAQIEKELNEAKIDLAQRKSRSKMLEEQLLSYTNNIELIKSELTHIKPKYNLDLSKVVGKISTVTEPKEVELALITESTLLFKQRQTEVKESLANKQSEQGKIKLLIKQHQETQDLIKENKQQIESLNGKIHIQTTLSQIVGKDEFRNYVLSLVEKNLIQATNFQLNKLCQGRYILKQEISHSNASSDFYIIDKVNYSMLRKVSTLSGGETFMVSLAMAIALSELTRGSQAIDSFFIDEGFGTLDSDSIEEVLEMIQTIQNQGKNITLISHIKDITSRIPVNLQVNKSEAGHSKISVLYQ